jgi:hypothetical protein
LIQELEKDVTQESLDNDWSERAASFGLTKEYIETLVDPRQKKEKEVIVKGDNDNGFTIPGKDKSTNENEIEKPDEKINPGRNKEKDNSDNREDRKPEIHSENEHDVHDHERSKEDPIGDRQPKTKEEHQNPGAEHSGVNDEGISKSWMDRLWAFFKKDDQQSVPGNTNAALNQKVQDVEELSDRERAIREAVFYAVGHHTERDMLVTRSNIEATALNKSKAMFKIDDVNNELDRLLKNGILVQSDTGKLTTKDLLIVKFGQLIM